MEICLFRENADTDNSVNQSEFKLWGEREWKEEKEKNEGREEVRGREVSFNPTGL